MIQLLVLLDEISLKLFDCDEKKKQGKMLD